ncbi:hypothetical protein [Paraburkholderia caballeronis]|uniref:hypothetical protein n=1 Tax=Paraburkholderia caballeronis TaxID=416943 RepID=UPI001065970C|nr:hypothetical protein [Paraburkholderia caballeronis]TDV18332.1 hypothetical protein C7408_10388 [Paraburkholderia caballeronis]TDV20130.1 hypothetical protein C7406_103353 [Paraburkholderia caballeronis]TDV28347.1 hypothetical protein C7404_103353 [Paraburkholderia caballeronis]TDV36963.1 hypothetical protein C7405_10389 [Paraburkholderia caballeronis]
MKKLEEFDYFHDWNIDSLTVRDRHKLIISMEYDGNHATVIFNGTSRCTVEHFSVSNNIIFEMKLLKPGDTNYDLALAMLSKSERFSDTQGSQTAIVLATAGAELAIEFESLDIEAG